MKKQWDLKPRKLVQLVNFKKPYQIVSSQAVSFSQGWTRLKIGRMNMTNLDFVFGCFCFRVSVKKLMILWWGWIDFNTSSTPTHQDIGFHEITYLRLPYLQRLPLVHGPKFDPGMQIARPSNLMVRFIDWMWNISTEAVRCHWMWWFRSWRPSGSDFPRGRCCLEDISNWSILKYVYYTFVQEPRFCYIMCQCVMYYDQDIALAGWWSEHSCKSP